MFIEYNKFYIQVYAKYTDQKTQMDTSLITFRRQNEKYLIPKPQTKINALLFCCTFTLLLFFLFSVILSTKPNKN